VVNCHLRTRLQQGKLLCVLTLDVGMAGYIVIYMIHGLTFLLGMLDSFIWSVLSYVVLRKTGNVLTTSPRSGAMPKMFDFLGNEVRCGTLTCAQTCVLIIFRISLSWIQW
jgi:hypothetical protein